MRSYFAFARTVLSTYRRPGLPMAPPYPMIRASHLKKAVCGPGFGLNSEVTSVAMERTTTPKGTDQAAHFMSLIVVFV